MDYCQLILLIKKYNHSAPESMCEYANETDINLCAILIDFILEVPGNCLSKMRPRLTESVMEGLKNMLANWSQLDDFFLENYNKRINKEEQKEIKYFIWKNLHNHLSPFGRYHSYKALDADSFDSMEEDWNSILQRCKDNIERRANR